MNPITRPGTYARKIGMTQPMTGPIATSSSSRQGLETQTLNPTQARVRADATAKRTVGRSPEAGALRRVRPPSRPEGSDPGSPPATEISSSIGTFARTTDRYSCSQKMTMIPWNVPSGPNSGNAVVAISRSTPSRPVIRSRA